MRATKVALGADDSAFPRPIRSVGASTRFAKHFTVETSRLVLTMFLIAQVCDGIFTYTAVQAFGVVAEGNVLLATWMGLIGPGPTILGAKILAAACGVLLYCLGVRRILAGLTLFYAVAAIAPWLVVLHHV